MLDKHRIIITDDNAILRKGLRSVIDHTDEFLVVGEAGDGIELLDLLKSGVVPNLLILDLSMPKMSGIEALFRIKQMPFSFKTLVLTMHKEQDIFCRAFSAGADGYMLKDSMARELTSALRILLEDKIYISASIGAVLPETCAIKSCAGRELSSSPIVHCGKNLAGSVLETV